MDLIRALPPTIETTLSRPLELVLNSELFQVGGFLFYLKNFSPAQVGGFVRPTTRSLEQLDGYQPPYVITRPTTLTFNQRYCPHALIYIASRVALAYTSI